MSQRFKRLSNPLLATFVAVLFFVGAPQAALAQSAKLTILHVNDVYQMGSLAELSTLLKKERALAENHITTLGGDLIAPSIMSGITQGAQMITLMNAIGLDLAGFGNHEFDFGSDVLAARMTESEFLWLATNTFGADGQPFGGATSTVIRDVGEFKVGFFSLLTPETAVLVKDLGEGVSIEPALEAAQKAVSALREQGANFVAAITHLTIAEDREIARSVRGLDIILGGHEHDPIMFYEGGTLILKAGIDAEYLAVADIEFSKSERRGRVRYSMRPQWKLISTAGVAPDQEIAAIIKGFEDELAAKLNVVVGKTETDLDSQRGTVRSRESSMGNLIADAIRVSMGADVGLANGGGIRGDRTYDAGTELTRKDILAELPFGNVTMLIELTGADLLAALENGVSRVEDTAGRFPQVSGVTFAFDPKLAAGARVSDVKVGGADLDPARHYTVATNDFISGGGDGYAALTRGKALIDAAAATLLATTVMDYIEKLGTVSPKVEGRITIK